MPTISLETRARRLLSRRYSRNTARFETLLQTVRRPLLSEMLPSSTTIFAKNNFFTRQYSTAVAGRLISKLTVRATRFAPSMSSSLLSNYQVVTNRYRIVPRMEARDRKRYVRNVRNGVASTNIDTRFTRVKSPRSRQYVLRASIVTSATARVSSLEQHRALSGTLIAPTKSGLLLYRTRRYVHATTMLVAENTQTAVQQKNSVGSTNTKLRKAGQRSTVLVRQSSRLLPKYAVALRTSSSSNNLGKIAHTLKHTMVTSHIANANARSFAATCSQITRQERTALFDTFRARLWYRLTNRRMKRHRIARH